MEIHQVLPRDAIPSVDDPEFADDHEGTPDDDVVVVTEGGEARAYPIRYLNYHEIVNDRVGGRPVAVTWCPLCGSAVVYDRRVGKADGAVIPPEGVPDDGVLTFGVSGKLADDDLVMYDRETESEWKQSLGEAIAGPLAGAELAVRPAAVVPYRRFAADHPEGVVLAPPGGKSEAASDGDEPAPVEYDDEPYREYFDSAGFGLAAHRGGDGREWDRADLDPKEVVLGVERDGEALGFPHSRVEAAGGVVAATVGGRRVAVFATPDGIHAFAADGLAFEPTDVPGQFRADGARWDGATGESDDGRALDRVPAGRLFAFAWQDDHGPDAFYDPEGAQRSNPDRSSTS